MSEEEFKIYLRKLFYAPVSGFDEEGYNPFLSDKESRDLLLWKMRTQDWLDEIYMELWMIGKYGQREFYMKARGWKESYEIDWRLRQLDSDCTYAQKEFADASRKLYLNHMAREEQRKKPKYFDARLLNEPLQQSTLQFKTSQENAKETSDQA